MGTAAQDQSLDAILATIKRVGNLAELAPQQDFYDAGMSSVASLNLLLELEDLFNVALPDTRFVECRTAQQLHALVNEVKA